MSAVWLITGCSSGFGESLALLALRNGHRVIATSRRPNKTPDLVAKVKKLGGTWLPLDVTDPNVENVVKETLNVYGRVDVLVNAAGYALLGAFETFTAKQCRDQMETNFFGPLAVTRAILPSMRERRSGTIVNISSTAGIEAKPSRTMYSGSKFALEAFSEALRDEVSPFGVRVLCVQPGGFLTKFSGSISVPELPMPKEYEGGMMAKMFELVKADRPDLLPGDVEKGVQAIWDVVMRTGQAEGMEDLLRLPLGKDGIVRWKAKIETLEKTMEVTEKIWSSTDRD